MIAATGYDILKTIMLCLQDHRINYHRFITFDYRRFIVGGKSFAASNLSKKTMCLFYYRIVFGGPDSPYLDAGLGRLDESTPHSPKTCPRTSFSHLSASPFYQFCSAKETHSRIVTLNISSPSVQLPFPFIFHAPPPSALVQASMPSAPPPCPKATAFRVNFPRDPMA